MNFECWKDLTEYYCYDEINLIGKDVQVSGKRIHFAAIMKKGEQAELCMLTQKQPVPEESQELQSHTNARPKETNRDLMSVYARYEASPKKLQAGDDCLEFGNMSAGEIHTADLGGMLLLMQLTLAGWQLPQEHPFREEDWERLELVRSQFLWALTTPLALFEGQCELRPGREIHTIRDLRPLKGSPALDGSPVKGLVALFLAETLDLLLRRAEADSPLSDFLFGSVAVLDSMRRPAALANFHLVFLYRLAAMLGVEPDVSEWEPGMHFDMRDACFRPTAPLHSDFLPPAEAAVVPLLARLGYRGMHLFRANRSERNAAVDHMMRYFSIHLAPLTSLKSLAVLREMGGD